MMRDNELDILMQSLSEEEIGSLYASLPDQSDPDAAGRIANRFYAKCAAAGMPMKNRIRQHKGIKIKYMGIAAAACVAVAASVAAYQNAQTEEPGIIPEPGVTVAVTELTTSYTEAVTTAAETGSTAKTAGSRTTTGSETQSTAADSGEQTEPAVTEPVQTESGAAVSIVTVPGTGGTGITGSSTQSTVSTTATYTSTTVTSATYTSATTWYTSTTRPVSSTTAGVEPPVTTRIVTSTELLTTMATSATSEPSHEHTGPATSRPASDEGPRRDHASAWLVHAPKRNTYMVGEDYDLTGTQLGVWYYSQEYGVMESYKMVPLLSNLEMFTIDDSDYDASTPGTYAIRVIYDRGEYFESATPAPPAVVSIFVTVQEN